MSALLMPFQNREMQICERSRALGASPSCPAGDERHYAERFVAGHEDAARITGRTYAETLFNVTGGEEPNSEWFDERIRDLGRSFNEFYTPRLRHDGINEAFVKHMLDVACRAMFERLAELVDQPSVTKGRAN